MSRPLENDEISARLFGERGATGDRGDRVAFAVNDQQGTANTTTKGARLLGREPRPVLRREHRLAVGLETPRDRVLDLLRRMRFREHLRHEELDPVAIVAQPVEPVVLGPTLRRVVLRVEVVDGSLRSGSPPPRKFGPMKTAPSMRSGCSAASRRPRCPPSEKPTMTALAVCVSSMTARASAANSRRRRPKGCCGRSERPLPRPSNVTTRQWRARYGICIFQCRECNTDHVGKRSTVGSPEP